MNLSQFSDFPPHFYSLLFCMIICKLPLFPNSFKRLEKTQVINKCKKIKQQSISWEIVIYKLYLYEVIEAIDQEKLSRIYQ